MKKLVENGFLQFICEVWKPDGCPTINYIKGISVFTDIILSFIGLDLFCYEISVYWIYKKNRILKCLNK